MPIWHRPPPALAGKSVVIRLKRYCVVSFVMSDIQIHRQRIQDLLDKLKQMGAPPGDVAEFTINANAVRQNEYLQIYGQIQSEIIDAYGQYAQLLEQSAVSLLEVQRKMLDIIKTQAANC